MLKLEVSESDHPADTPDAPNTCNSGGSSDNILQQRGEEAYCSCAWWAADVDSH